MPTVGNVRLATGYKWHEDGSVTTLTSLFTVVSENGIITSLNEQDGMVTARTGEMDAAGLLGIPPAREMHLHLDKGHFGGPWQAVVPVEGGVSGRIREEQQFLPEFLEYLPERADALVKHFAANGTRFIRAQTNVDPRLACKTWRSCGMCWHRMRHASKARSSLFPSTGRSSRRRKDFSRRPWKPVRPYWAASIRPQSMVISKPR